MGRRLDHLHGLAMHGRVDPVGGDLPGNGAASARAPVVLDRPDPVSLILAALTSAPSLTRIATPELAAELAAMVTPTRPVELVVLALGQLSVHARDAAQDGETWLPWVLKKKARAYVSRARWPDGEAPGPGLKKTSRALEWHDGELPPAHERAAMSAVGWRALLAALG